MNTRERFLATMTFKEPDRVLLWEAGYWADTLRRWYKEGLPKVKGIPDDAVGSCSVLAESIGVLPGRYVDHDVHSHFKMDSAVVRVPLNIGAYPPFERKVIEDHGDWYIWQDPDGCLLRETKDRGTLPSIVSTPVKTREDWERYKAERLKPTLEGRLPANWDELVKEYKNRDYPLWLGQRHGFFGTPRFLLGEVEVLTMYYDDPELMKDINNYLTDFWIALFDGVLKEVEIDAVFIWEDMCYKGGPLVSPAIFREFILPGYQKLTSFLKERGVKIIVVDSDGNVWKLIPLWIEGGVTAIFPFEVAAGMDVVEVRKAFPKLAIIGGIDKRVTFDGQNKEAIDHELEAKVPFMLKSGGYIPHIDHAVSPETSFENFKYYRQKLEEIARKYSKARDRD